jgi:hypothetical protein
MSRETISALADSDIAEGGLPAALAALHTEEGRASWDLYHHIGDALRSSELADNVGCDFAARMAARMATEAPLTGARSQVPAALFEPGALHTPLSYAEATRGARRTTPGLPVLCAEAPDTRLPRTDLSGRQLTMSISAVSAALAAVATAAIMASPPFGAHGRAAPLSGANLTATHLAAGAQVPESTDHILVSGKAAAHAAATPGDGADELGSYVRAHQDLAPSPYRSARYVRPASMPAAGDN